MRLYLDNCCYNRPYDGQSATTVSLEAQAKLRVQEIMSTGVKPKDAYHVACALYAGCYSFLTTDKRLLRYQCEGMLLENPIDFVRRVEEV